MVVWEFRWGLGWSKMIEIEVGDTLKVSQEKNKFS